MIDFGDFEPEDAWYPDDDLAALIENLRARVRLLFIARTLPVIDTIDDIFEAVIAARRSRILDAREELRANDLDEDIAFVRIRMAAD